MKHLTGILIILDLLLLCAVIFLSARTPQTYEGFIIDKTPTNVIVEYSIPVSADQLIGLEVGDPYFLQEVENNARIYKPAYE